MKNKKPAVITVTKKQRYWGQYEYCVHWDQRGIRNIGHNLDQARLHQLFKDWDHKPEFQKYWNNMNGDFKKPSVRQDLETVRSYLARRREQGEDFKLVFGWNCVYIYTNDVTVSDVFTHVRSANRLQITQVQVQGDAGVISLVNPRHSFRTYLRRREFTPEERESLLQWVRNQKDAISVSNSLLKWLETPLRGSKSLIFPFSVYGRSVSPWSSTYFYVEHDDSRYLTMLQMIKPGIIRRTWPVVKKEVVAPST